MDMTQSGELILDGVIFALDDCSDTRFFIFKSQEYEGMITIGFEALFQEEKYQGEAVAPFICVNQHETRRANVEDLIGCTYTVENIEETDEREDTLCVYEHEPMEKYTFTILEVLEKKVHIQLEGVAVVDGYADPYETAAFSGNFWLRYE